MRHDNMKETLRIRPGGAGVRLAVAILAGSMLGGCVSKDMTDLENYASEVLSRKSGRIEPLPEIKPYERYLYRAADAGARDPFEPFYDERPERVAARVDDAQQQRYRQEIEFRNREELENHDLDSLRMVGTLQNEQDLWGIVLDRTGTVHRVKVGNYLGRNVGKIINIGEDRIDLREIIADGQGGYEERQAALALTDR